MQSLYYKAFNYIENSKPNHLGIYFSLFLHLIILLFAIGLPDFFKPKKIPMPQVIPIEILNVSDVTSLTSKKENIEINLTNEEITYGNQRVKFKIDPFKKKCLLEGLDDIALSLETQ